MDNNPPFRRYKLLSRRAAIAGIAGTAGVSSAIESAGLSVPSSGPESPAVVAGRDLGQAIATAIHTGRYATGIGASYWAHPQDGVFLPPGIYDAGDILLTGNQSPFPALSLWATPGSVVIRIPDDRYLFYSNERLSRLFLSGITFVGGKGAFQHRYQGTNVAGRFVFEHCVFDNYTECAIGNNAGDEPYLEVRGCTFMAAEKSSAIGISWGGYADGCVIESNAFLRNRYHLKIGPNPSGSIHILRNDFLRWDRTGPFDAAIWLVPETIPNRFGATSGWGTIIAGNKFGNENMEPGDLRLLIAREGPGATRQRRAHLERFDKGGSGGAFLSGITLRDNRISAVGAVTAPVIRSWIAEVRNLAYLNNRHDGGLHSYLCEFMGPRTGDYANANWTVRIDNATGILGSSPFAKGMSNCPIGPQWDSALEAIAEETILPSTGGDDTSFSLLARADRPDSFHRSGPNITTTIIADHAGQPRAVEVTTSGRGTGLAGPLSNVVEGRQGWIALDLCCAERDSVETIEIRIFNYATGTLARRMRCVLPSEWRRVRIPFTLPVSSSPETWQYLVVDGDALAGKRFCVARLYVHHGREPQADGHLLTIGDGKWDGGHLVMGNTHIWEEGGALYMKVNGSPTGPDDGKRLI